MVFLVHVVSIAACKKSPPAAVPLEPPDLIVTELSPNHGPMYTEANIFLNHLFGTNQLRPSKFYLNGKLLEVVSSSSLAQTLFIPKGAGSGMQSQRCRLRYRAASLRLEWILFYLKK